MSTTVMILGSPRKKGNSETIATMIAEGAKSKGNEIKTFFLNDYEDLRGCQSCYGCKKAGHCVQDDDTTPILDAIREADSIIIATPTYLGFSSAQYRTVEDRFFGFLGPDFAPNIGPGKKVAIVETCGGGIDGAKANANAIETVWKNYLKADVVGKIVVGYGPNDSARKDPVTLAEAKEIGKRLRSHGAAGDDRRCRLRGGQRLRVPRIRDRQIQGEARMVEEVRIAAAGAFAFRRHRRDARDVAFPPQGQQAEVQDRLSLPGAARCRDHHAPHRGLEASSP